MNALDDGSGVALPSTSGQIRVLVADRQPLFRDAVARAVRQRAHLRFAAEAGDGRRALELMRRDAPDVAIVGVDLPLLDGHAVLNAVVRDELSTRVLLVTPTAEAKGGYDAIAAGACGWFSKTSGAQELCDAVTTIAAGRTAFCRDVQTTVASEIRRRAQLGDPILTERERAILTLVARGWSVDRIGRELHVSAGTVKSVLLRVYRRLGVSERAAAVAVALRRGLID